MTTSLRRKIFAPASLLALLPLAAALAGCSSSAPANVRGEMSPDRAPSLPALTPAITHPPRTCADVFLIAEGENAGEKIDISRDTAITDVKGVWMERRRASSASAPYLEETFAMTSEGDATLVRSIDRREGVISTFEPPLVVCPARLKPGETFKQSVQLTIHPVNEPDTVQDQGPATQELTYIGDADLLLPGASPLTGAHMRAVFKVKLAAATVQNTTDTWHPLPGGPLSEPQGLIAERSDQSAKFLGLSVRDKKTFLHLAPP